MPGGGSSGSTMQTSNSSSNSTNTSGPNPFIAPGLQNLVNGANGWIGGNTTMPGYFPGGTVAPMSSDTSNALTATRNFATNGLANLDSSLAPATNYFTDAANGKYLDIANDPNWQAALAASLRPGTENFTNVIEPGIDSTFAGSGRTGSGAHFDTMMRGVNDLTRNQADASAMAASDRYNQERGYQASAAGALPGLAATKAQLGSGYTGMLSGVGAAQDAYLQRQLDAANAKYGYDTSGQLDWYNRLAQSLQSMYPGGQTTGEQSGSSTSYGTGQPAGGGAGSIIGPATSAVGLGLSAAALFM